MTTATLTIAPSTRARRRHRASVAIGAVLATLIVYAMARLALGHVYQPAFGSSQPKNLSAGFVVVVAALAALLGWAAISTLERVSAHAVATWTIAAPLVLLVSFSMPLSGHGVSGGNRVALMLMHLAVAAVVIPLYRASSPRLAH